MAKTHNLVKLEEQIGSYPAYRWYVECSCGFQARMGQKIHVEGQFNAHLQNNGLVPIEFEEKKAQPKTPQIPWTPTGVK